MKKATCLCFLCFLILLFLLGKNLKPISSFAATYTCGMNGVNNSCTPAGLTSLIGSASDGDTINIASGTHDWSAAPSTGVVIDKRITINGGGVCNNTTTGCGKQQTPTSTWPTTLDKGAVATNQFFLIKVTTGTSGTVRITGIKFYGYSNAAIYNWWNDTPGYFIVESNLNIAQYRIDNNQFQNLSSGASFQSGDIYTRSFKPGLIDHNWFNHVSWDGHVIMITRVKPGVEYPDVANIPGGSTSWAEDINWGSSNFVFIEDNTFIHGCDSSPTYIFGPAGIDCLNGGKFVLRYNNIQNTGPNSGHDISGGMTSRACKSAEVYNNVTNWETCGSVTHYATAHNIRGGAAFFFENQYSGFQYNFNVMQNRGSWPACSSVNAYDGDSVSPNGYRCLDAPGSGKASGITLDTIQPQDYEPTRIWSNTGNNAGGCSYGGWVSEHGGWVCNKWATYVINGIDYILSTDDSAKPAGYTPYTYPHPLASGAGGGDTTPPSAPTGLTVQ